MKFARLTVLTTILITLIGVSESKSQKILDKPWIKENTPTRRVVPYTYVREADVMWHKRIWREIDLREKINHPLYFPLQSIQDRKSLFDVIKYAVTEEKTLKAYDPVDDEFTVPLSVSEAVGRMGDSLTIMTEDEFGDPTIPKISYNPMSSQDIVKYRLKEDWFFDRERSIMDVRIIGICPFSTAMAEDGTVKGLKPVFWVYFPEARYVFANYDVFNRQNDAERRTFEDIFWKRMFNSYIYKESNVYDRMIIDYKEASPIELLFEADRIKDDLFKMEHDLWHF
ncbi:MAG: gliding motility protein GldN [Flavobacteriales bacterium CG_4_10_14_0_2_um_filter_32_8]|nr:MAG: gliding motility protein GldN [Flavobacteriales bacterium CG_4_10_14_0_2_um_filter_32_8]PJB14947.1 MAG: gliding motility protein GldN [Flavobacteriales bacterium CG_4_9_14_3_um_filter_32_8]